MAEYTITISNSFTINVINIGEAFLLIGKNNKYFNSFTTFHQTVNNMGVVIFEANGDIYLYNDYLAFGLFTIYQDLTEIERKCIADFYNGETNIIRDVPPEDVEVIVVDDCQYTLKIEDNKLLLKLPEEIVFTDIFLKIGEDNIIFQCYNNVNQIGVFKIGRIRYEEDIFININNMDTTSNCITLFNNLTEININDINNYFSVEREITIDNVSSTICIDSYKLFIEECKLQLQLPTDLDNELLKYLDLLIGQNGLFFNYSETFNTPELGKIITKINGDKFLRLENIVELNILFDNLSTTMISNICNFYSINQNILFVNNSDKITQLTTQIFDKNSNLYTVSIIGDELILKIPFTDECLTNVELTIKTDNGFFDCFTTFKTQEIGFISDNVLVIEEVSNVMVIYKNLTETEIEIIDCFYKNQQSVLKINDGTTIIDDVYVEEIPFELYIEQAILYLSMPINTLGVKNNTTIDNFIIEIKLIIGNDLFFDKFCDFNHIPQNSAIIEKDDIINVILNNVTVESALNENGKIIFNLFENLSDEEIKQIATFYDITRQITVTVNSTVTNYDINFVDTVNYKLSIENSNFILTLKETNIEKIEINIGKDLLFFNCCQRFIEQNVGTIIYNSDSTILLQVKYITVNTIILFTDLNEELEKCIVDYYNTDNFGIVLTLINSCKRTDIPIENFYNVNGVYVLLNNNECQLVIQDTQLILNVSGSYSNIELLIGVDNKYFGEFETFIQQTSGTIIFNQKNEIIIQLIDNETVLFENLTQEQINAIMLFYSEDRRLILHNCGETINKIAKLTNNNSIYKLEIVNNELFLSTQTVNTVELKIGENNKYFRCFETFRIPKNGVILVKNNGDIYIKIDSGGGLLYSDLTNDEINCMKIFYIVEDKVILLINKDKCREEIVQEEVKMDAFCNEIYEICCDDECTNNTTILLGGFCKYELKIEDNSLVFYFKGTIASLELTIGNKCLFDCGNVVFNDYDGEIITYSDRKTLLVKTFEENKVVLFRNLTVDNIKHIKKFYNTFCLTNVIAIIDSVDIKLEEICFDCLVCDKYKDCYSDCCKSYDCCCENEFDLCSNNYQIKVINGKMKLFIPSIENIITIDLIIGKKLFFNCFETFKDSIVGVLVTTVNDIKIRITENFSKIMTIYCDLNSVEEKCINDFYSCKTFNKCDIILTVCKKMPLYETVIKNTICNTICLDNCIGECEEICKDLETDIIKEEIKFKDIF